MRIHTLLAAGALVAALAACNDSTGNNDFQCDSFVNVTAGTKGDTITTATGLRYIETKLGTGQESVSCLGAEVAYVLTVNGAVVDRSGADNFRFYPGQHGVVAGFEQGVVGMKLGGTRRLIIPPALGYGAQPVQNPNTGAVIIPANSTLIFDLELTELEQR